MSTSNPVKTAARTLDLFEVFAETRAPMTLTEIAAHMESPISSCHALIRTLQARGYIYVMSQHRRCYPTRRLLDVAAAIAAHDPIVEKLHPLLERLRDATRETIILGKRNGDEVIYLDVIEGLETIRYVARPGERKPLHSSAIGKAMLSLMSAAEFDAFLKAASLKRITETTITDPGTFRDDIDAGRSQGYFITKGENVADVMGLAVIRKIDGEAFSVAIAGPIDRMTQNKSAYLKTMVSILGEGVDIR